MALFRLSTAWRQLDPLSSLWVEAIGHQLLAAGVVLVITAILVSLPSPRRAGAGGPPGGPGEGSSAAAATAAVSR